LAHWLRHLVVLSILSVRVAGDQAMEHLRPTGNDVLTETSQRQTEARVLLGASNRSIDLLNKVRHCKVGDPGPTGDLAKFR
jgi:hypothetical protein